MTMPVAVRAVSVVVVRSAHVSVSFLAGRRVISLIDTSSENVGNASRRLRKKVRHAALSLVRAYDAAMSKLLITIALSLAACGGNKQPPSSEPQATPPTPSTPANEEPHLMTPDECTAKGGQVRGDIGDGQIACAEGEQDLGRVQQGIEGAICCAPPAAP